MKAVLVAEPAGSVAAAAASDRRALRSARPHSAQPCEVRGKFLFVDNQKFYVRGVTYGPFRPNGTGDCYPDPIVVAEDFARMAANAVNALRTYTVPPL